MSIIRLSQIACLTQLLLLSGVQTQADEASNPWKFLPTRALRVPGGAVSFQAGIRCDRDPRRFNRVFARHPTEYFVVVTNERESPIWIAVEWRFPDDKPMTVEGRIAPGRFAVPYWRSKGLIEDTAIPFKIWIHADAGRTQELAMKETSFFFPGREKERFLGAVYKAFLKGADSGTRECPVLSGWEEVTTAVAGVPGRTADLQLQEDIKVLLGKEQSKSSWECQHEVIRAEPVKMTDSAILAKMPADVRQSTEQLQDKDGLHLERWSIKSCDATTRYEVLMTRSPKEGTDLLVERLVE